MNSIQIACIVGAVCVAAYGVWEARRRRPSESFSACAADSLALAAKLRELNCPEGVAACQRLLNVVLEHPEHGKHQPPEVKT
jgi:hypothetical protein